MQIFTSLNFWYGFAIVLFLVAVSNYFMVKAIEHFWDYDSKDPGFQLRNKIELGLQLANAPWYLVWFYISIVIYNSLIALGLGSAVMFVISLIAIAQMNTFEDIPLHVLNYNYSIGVSKSRKKTGIIRVGNRNPKTGRRFEYWRGHGRYI